MSLLKLFCSLSFALAVCGVVHSADAADMKLEARLVWGTNDEKSPNPDHRLMNGDLAKKLKTLPFKWKNFFEVNRKTFTAKTTDYTKVEMSKKCMIEVKHYGDSRVSVKLWGEGKFVNKTVKPLPIGEVLAIAGDDKDQSAWFIIVQQVAAK